MAKLRPKMFIGSSSEAMDRRIPQRFRDKLREFVDATLWTQARQFDTGNSTMDALFEAANEYDFALLLFTPDDEVKSRGESQPAPRDNVVFELGLFMGALGPDRVFGVMESGKDLKLPCDIDGTNIRRFSTETDDITESEIHKVALGLGRKIEQQGRRMLELHLARRWRYKTDARVFEIRLGSARLERSKSVIGRRGLAILARVQDEKVNPEDDLRIVVTPIRPLPSPISGDLLFEIPGDKIRAELRPGDTVVGHVLLVPEGTDLERYKTLRELRDIGCHDLETVTYELGRRQSEPQDGSSES